MKRIALTEAEVSLIEKLRQEERIYISGYNLALAEVCQILENDVAIQPGCNQSLINRVWELKK